MHRWHFQRLVRTLVPLLLLATLMCVVMVRLLTVGGGRVFRDDESYGHLAVARNILESGAYGLVHDEPMPATRDALWRLLLAGGTLLTRDPMSASLLLGALCATLTLLVLVRVARLLFPFPPFILYAAVLLIVSPQFIMDALSGSSGSLATCLAVSACLIHIEGLQARRNILSLYAVLLLALAMWVRIEFVVYWFAIWIHTGILALVRPGGGVRCRPSYVFVRGLTGLLVLALCMLPLVTWNATLSKVPWPRTIGAPLALDIWSTAGPAAAARQTGEAIVLAIPAAYAALYEIPFLESGFVRVVFWFGLAVLLALAAWRREERPFTLFALIPVVLPLLCAVLVPYLGTGGVQMVLSAFQPIAVLVAVFGFFRIPFFIEGIYRKYRAGLPVAMGFNTWWIVMGSVFLLFCLWQSMQVLETGMQGLQRSVAERKRLDDAIRQQGLAASLMAADRPGWLAYEHRPKLLDLGGEATLEVLMCVGARGGINPDELHQLLETARPRTLLISRPEYRFVEDLVKGRLLVPPADAPDEGGARLLTIQWPGGS